MHVRFLGECLSQEHTQQQLWHTYLPGLLGCHGVLASYIIPSVAFATAHVCVSLYALASRKCLFQRPVAARHSPKYTQLSLLEVHLGGNWYLEYLEQTLKANKKKPNKANNKGPSPLQRSSSFGSNEPGSSWDGFLPQSSGASRLLERSESLEADLAAVAGSNTLRRRRQLAQVMN